jgi:hypothetical protein
MGVAAGANTMPAYAAAPEHTGETMAIFGLIIGIIGIPASIIPILGLLFGVTGLVLSTVSRSKRKRPLTVFGIVFSVLAILAGLALWVYAVAHDPQLHKTNAAASSSSASSADLVSITTPCYTVKVDKGLNNYTPNGCNFDAASATEEFTVGSQSNPDVDSSNLAKVAQQSLTAAASSSKATIKSEQSGQFAGSPAYIANLVGTGTNSGKDMITALALHQSAKGNLFLAIHVVAGGQQASFGPLESTWQWK